jgi:hypothetical protein
VKGEARSLDPSLTDALRAHGARVPADLADRLANARRTALDALPDDTRPHDALPHHRPGRRPWGSLGTWSTAAAGLILAIVLAAQLLPDATTTMSEPTLWLASADELQVIADLDVLEELEFLAWLDDALLDAH